MSFSNVTPETASWNSIWGSCFARPEGFAPHCPIPKASRKDVTNRPAQGIEPAIDFEVRIVRALADGSYEARRAALAEVESTTAANAFFLPALAVSATVLGFPETALAMLEGFYFGRGKWAADRAERPQTGFLFGPSATALRRHPGFASLITEIGLEDYWRSTGTQPDYRSGG